MSEQERHALADYWHPVAIAERQLEARLVSMRAAGEFDQLLSRLPHEYHNYRCLTCRQSEIRCRAERAK